MTIKYPTWKVRSAPTPTDKLVICPVCGIAEWVLHGGGVKYCDHRRYPATKKPARMREATKAEYVEGKAALQTIIG